MIDILWLRAYRTCAPGPLRRWPPVVVGMAGVSAALLVLAACSSTSTPVRSTTASSTASKPTIARPGTSNGASPAPTSPPASSLGANLPLFPFATAQAIGEWQQSYLSGGHQPWHLDAGQTALAFAAWLGYQNIDTVIGAVTDQNGAHVSVGFHPGGIADRTSTSAVVHLVRWGAGSAVPWEVVGTDDTTFSLDRPSYGASVTSPVQVGGRITGVDENIKVQVRSASAASGLGGFCCRPAGGSARPWSATVTFTAAPRTVLTIAAQTGGHVAAVERFAVTAVRVAA